MDRRWRRVQRATTRLLMTSVMSAARAWAGVPPTRDARRGSSTGSGRARRTAANPVRPAGRRYPVRSATRVCGRAGRLPPLSGRPSRSRQASPGRNPRPANPSRRRRRSRRPARHPARPNHCSRRSPGPSPSPRPGARWSRRLRRGVLRNLPHGARPRRRLRRGAPRSGGSLRRTPNRPHFRLLFSHRPRSCSSRRP
jgi:hypothetical protein